METRGRKRPRSDDDVGTGGTGGAGPPRRAFLAGRGASAAAGKAPAAAGDNSMSSANPVENDQDRFNYMHDKIQIRSQHTADKARRWPRSNLVLFLKGLRNLPPGTNIAQNGEYKQAAQDALREADEPEGIMNLTKLGAARGLERVLGNKNAGKLFESIFAQKLRDTAAGRNADAKVERVRSFLPIEPFKSSNYREKRLMELFPDGGGSWMWDLLRSACFEGLDVRYRSLREFGTIDAEGRAGSSVISQGDIPPLVSFRQEQVNAMIHGGDVRLDALMCQLKFANSRFSNRLYDPWVEYTSYYDTLFKHKYGMSSEVALWLSEHGIGWSHGVNWDRLVTTINIYVTIRRRIFFVSHGRGGLNYTGLSYTDIHQGLFLPFVEAVVALIKFLKQNPDSTADQSLLDTATKYRNTLYTVCQRWTAPEDTAATRIIHRGRSGKAYERSIWHLYSRGNRWRAGFGTVIDEEWTQDEDVWTCIDNDPPTIQSINVPDLLRKYGQGTPDSMKGWPDDLLDTEREIQHLEDLAISEQEGSPTGTGGSQGEGATGVTGDPVPESSRSQQRQGPGGGSQGRGAGAGAPGRTPQQVEVREEEEQGLVHQVEVRVDEEQGLLHQVEARVDEEQGLVHQVEVRKDEAQGLVHQVEVRKDEEQKLMKEVMMVGKQ